MARKIWLVIAGLVAGMTFLPLSSFAHHAMEYIDLEGYTMTGEGEKIFYVMFDYTVPDKDISGEDHWEITPGISYGITERLMFDIHAHFAKFGIEHVVSEERAGFADPEGPSPFIEAVAVSLQYQLSGKGQLPVDIALAAKYEHPLSRSRRLLGGEEVIKGTFILSRDLGEHRNILLNLSYGQEHSSPAYGGRGRL